MKNLNNLLGKKVIHIFRENYQGIVVDVDENKLPLIGVDCGKEFVSYIPWMDLALAETYPKSRGILL